MFLNKLLKILKISNLNEAECGQIIGLYKGGNSKVQISKILGFSRTTVIWTIQNYEEWGNIANLSQSGWPKKINNDHKKVQDVYLKLIKSMPRRIEACIASNGWPTKF